MTIIQQVIIAPADETSLELPRSLAGDRSG